MNKNLKRKMIEKLCGFYYDLYPAEYPTLLESGIKTFDDLIEDKDGDIFIVPKSNFDLKILISLSMLLFGKHCNLNFINIKNIDDLSNLFSYEYYYCPLQDILAENLFKVVEKYSVFKELREYCKDIESKSINNDYKTNRSHKFKDFAILINENYDFSVFNIQIRLNRFNGFINEWNTKNVEVAYQTFICSDFNQHKLELDLSSLKNAESMFYEARFSKEFIGLNSTNLEVIDDMFYECNPKSIHLDLSNVKSINHLFADNIEPNAIKNIIFPKEIEVKKINKISKFFPLEKINQVKNTSFECFIRNLSTKMVARAFAKVKYFKVASLRELSLDQLAYISNCPFFNVHVKIAILKTLEKALLKKGNDKYFLLEDYSIKEIVDVVNLLNKFIPKHVNKLKERNKTFFIDNNILLQESKLDFNKNSNFLSQQNSFTTNKTNLLI